jgi:hypothetical protein
MAARIVAAVSPDVQGRIRAILADCEVRFVDTGAELARALDEAPCDLALVGLHFEESSALPALEQVFSREHNFPVVCVRGRPFQRLEERSLNGLRMALSELGVDNFIDLLQYPDDPAGNAHLAAALERVMSRRLRNA